MDNRSAMQRYIGEINRQGRNGMASRYTYILDNDDFTNAWIKMHDDLGYPLMVDSRHRRAIVYNKKGLEQKIQKMILECISNSMKELEKMVAEDIVNEVTNELNGLVQLSNGTITRSGKSNNRDMSKFANLLAKGMVKGVSDLIDEITNPNDNRRR